jgi:hypothetical protein
MQTRTQWMAAALVAATVATAAGTASALSGSMDLISPATCSTAQVGRLHTCAVPERTFTSPGAESAVPMRTKVTVTKSGTCTTTLTLKLSLEPQGEPAVLLPFQSTREIVLRRRDRAPITSLLIKDATPNWTKALNVPSSCRYSLQVVGNEPDVSSQAEAQAIIADLEQQLATKRTESSYYRNLVQYHRAFLFLQGVATNFHEELTNETVQELRAGAENALNTLSVLASSCGDSMTPEDSQNIMLLFFSLPQLGSADDWRNPDGSTKTLADCFGARDQEIYALVDRLAREHDGENGSQYEEALVEAETEVVELEYKLTLARSQLAGWLGGGVP